MLDVHIIRFWWLLHTFWCKEILSITSRFFIIWWVDVWWYFDSL